MVVMSARSFVILTAFDGIDGGLFQLIRKGCQLLVSVQLAALSQRSGPGEMVATELVEVSSPFKCL